MVSINIFEDITPYTLSKVSSILESVKDGDDLELNIASYGGELLPAISIIDLIQSKHLKTTANIVGFAASAAAILALSCDVVTMSSLGSLMIHSAWSEMSDSDNPGIKRCNQVQLQIINKRCKAISDKTLKQDNWYNANECLKLGLIDNIQDNSAIINAFYAKLKSEVLPMDEKVQEVVENIKELVESGDVSPETASDVVEELSEDVKVDADKSAETPVAEELSGDSEKSMDESKDDEKANDHDLLEVIEKLTEEVMSLKARVLALEDVKVDETVDEEVKAEVGCNESEDEKIKNRINNIYNSITMPQAVVANAPKAKNVVQKVDYKTYKAFINEY